MARDEKITMNTRPPAQQARANLCLILCVALSKYEEREGVSLKGVAGTGAAGSSEETGDGKKGGGRSGNR